MEVDEGHLRTPGTRQFDGSQISKVLKGWLPQPETIPPASPTHRLQIPGVFLEFFPAVEHDGLGLEKTLTSGHQRLSMPFIPTGFHNVQERIVQPKAFSFGVIFDVEPAQVPV